MQHKVGASIHLPLAPNALAQPPVPASAHPRQTSLKSISMPLPLQRLIPPASSKTLTLDNHEHDEDAANYDDDAHHDVAADDDVDAIVNALAKG